MLDASGGSVFLNLLGAAESALIRAAASTQTLGCTVQPAVKQRNIAARGKRPKVAPPLDRVRKDFRALKGRNKLRIRSRDGTFSPAKAGAGIQGGHDPQGYARCARSPGATLCHR